MPKILYLELNNNQILNLAAEELVIYLIYPEVDKVNG